MLSGEGDYGSEQRHVCDDDRTKHVGTSDDSQTWFQFSVSPTSTCRRNVRDDARRPLGGVGRSYIRHKNCRATQRGPYSMFGGFWNAHGGAHDAWTVPTVCATDLSLVEYLEQFTCVVL